MYIDPPKLWSLLEIVIYINTVEMIRNCPQISNSARLSVILLTVLIYFNYETYKHIHMHVYNVHNLDVRIAAI